MDVVSEKERRNSMAKEPLPPATATAAQDEVDFSSGYEMQYANEYRPLHVIHEVPPPDAKNAWFRDLKTILMIGFLLAVFLVGSVLLITLVITVTPWKIFAITAVYVVIAAVVIYVEVKSVHVR